MNFERLLDLVGDEPLFETGLLLSGDVNPAYLRRQLSSWVAGGRLWQMRRGLYALAPPYQKVRPHPFTVANRLVAGSYVSLQSALAHYSLIPEQAFSVTSVTIGRAGKWDTPLGRYLYRHLKPAMFFGYQRLAISDEQDVFIATPEKALLDLVYLQVGGDDPDYLESLRLQNMDQLDLDRLRRQAEASAKPQLIRAARTLADLARREQAATRRP